MALTETVAADLPNATYDEDMSVQEATELMTSQTLRDQAKQMLDNDGLLFNEVCYGNTGGRIDDFGHNISIAVSKDSTDLVFSSTDVGFTVANYFLAGVIHDLGTSSRHIFCSSWDIEGLRITYYKDDVATSFPDDVIVMVGKRDA